MKERCIICKKFFTLDKLYEYRGAVACEKHFEEAIKKKDYERKEIIERNKFHTERFRGLDLGNSTIGKANREILKSDIEIAKKQNNL